MRCNFPITEINFKFNDLSSRLKTFSNLEINQPNDEMLLAILTKLLVDKQFIINSNEIFEYILRRVDRSYQGINEIVKKLDILYPFIGENLDFINNFAKNHDISLNFLHRKEDVYCLDFSKKGFFASN